MYVLVNFWNRNIWNLIVFTFIKQFGLNNPNKHKCFISRWKDGKIMKDIPIKFLLYGFVCICRYFALSHIFLCTFPIFLFGSEPIHLKCTYDYSCRNVDYVLVTLLTICLFTFSKCKWIIDVISIFFPQSLFSENVCPNISKGNNGMCK